MFFKNVYLLALWTKVSLSIGSVNQFDTLAVSWPYAWVKNTISSNFSSKSHKENFNSKLEFYLVFSLTLLLLRLLSSNAKKAKNVKMWKNVNIILTLSCWHSLEISRWVVSDEYPFAMVSCFLSFLSSFHVDQIS